MSRSVLLVEDSRAVRSYVSSILECERGYEVDEVENGFEALQALSRRTYEIVVTDVNMPNINGIELTRFIRAQPRLRGTSVLVMSTDSAQADTQRALEAGADGFLAKPFSADEFVVALVDAQARGVS